MKKIIKGISTAVVVVIVAASLSVTALAATPKKEMIKPDDVSVTNAIMIETSTETATVEDGSKPEGMPEKGEKPEGAPEMKDGEKPAEAPTDSSSEKPENAPAKDGEKGVQPQENLEAILESIEAVEDDDLKESLLELYNAYVDALDAEKAALESDDTDEDELETLKTTTNEAREALLAALTEAGIEADLPEDNGEKPEIKEEKSDAATEGASLEEPAEVAEAAEKVAVGTTDNGDVIAMLKSKFSELSDYLKNLF